MDEVLAVGVARAARAPRAKKEIGIEEVLMSRSLSNGPAPIALDAGKLIEIEVDHRMRPVVGRADEQGCFVEAGTLSAWVGGVN